MQIKSGFTPLEKATDFSPVRKSTFSNGANRRLSPLKADGGSKPPSAQTVRELSSSLTGFTLIELILVSVLILAIISLSTPAFRNTFSDLAVRDASFNIAKLMNYAQDRAILDRKNFKIAFNFKMGSYQMLEKDLTAKDTPAYKKVIGRYGRVQALPKGASFKAARPEMIFYPDGHCDEIRLELFAKGRGYVITSKGFGNMVEVKEANLSQP